MAMNISNTPIKVVAEVSNVHLGDVNRAKNLIGLAKLAGADYIKFQKRNPIESVPKEIQNKPHPNKLFSYGNTYIEHRLALELTIEEHCLLQKCCADAGIGYATSVWDITSALQIIELDPDFIKVPSACNTNYEILDVLLGEYTGDIHISLGMTTQKELEDLRNYLQTFSTYYKRFVVYHCTSEYPCPFERLYLKEIEHLCNEFSTLGVRIGFSNHGLGIASDVAAYMLGAEWIERHFIDDRTIRHTDAAASLEPDGLRRLCRDLKAIPKALQYKKEMSEEELQQRDKLKYRPNND
jgi:sialic acid synthase